jgi:hypothetical protein
MASEAPALHRLLDDWAGRMEALLAMDDEDIYWEIEHAVGAQFYTESWHPCTPSRPTVNSRRLLERLSKGWFGTVGPASPQARYMNDGVLYFDATPAAGVAPVVEKPASGVWTASFLPSGATTWDRGESRFKRLGRELYELHFDESGVVVYVIDSLDDFAVLASRFPGAVVDGRVRLDWQKVKAEFDAVHLTAKGLLTADRCPVVTSEGVAELSGWGSQSTVWFRRPPGLRVGTSAS